MMENGSPDFSSDIEAIISKLFKRGPRTNIVYLDDTKIEEIGIDSLAFSQLVMDFEESFGLLSDNQIDELTAASTIGDVRKAFETAAKQSIGRNDA